MFFLVVVPIMLAGTPGLGGGRSFACGSAGDDGASLEPLKPRGILFSSLETGRLQENWQQLVRGSGTRMADHFVTTQPRRPLSYYLQPTTSAARTRGRKFQIKELERKEDD